MKMCCFQGYFALLPT